MSKHRTSRIVTVAALAGAALAALAGVSYASSDGHRGAGFQRAHFDSDDRRGFRKHGYGPHHGEYGKHGYRGGARMFDRFDADQDGKVTQAEVDAWVKERIQAFDTDNDGRLSLEEFQGLWLDHTRARMVDGFQRFDDNGDAQVTEAEMGARFRHMVEMFDRDGDGAVEMREMRRGHGHGHGDRDDD